MPLSKRQMRLLELMRDTGEELVAEGLQVWVGEERFSVGSYKAVLRIAAIKDVSDCKGLGRFVINDIGEGVLRRPELADEVAYAFIAGKNFTIKNDHVELMP